MSASIHKKNSQIAAASNAEFVLLKNLFERLPWVLLFSLIVATCTVTAFAGTQSWTILLAWYALMLATLAGRLILWWNFQRDGNQAARATNWRRRFVLGAAASGTAWGMAGVVLYDPSSIIAQIYLPFMLAGMSASSMVVQTGCMSAFTAFFLTAVTPYALRLGFEGDAAHLSMSVALVAYMAALAILGRSINVYLRASVQLAIC